MTYTNCDIDAGALRCQETVTEPSRASLSEWDVSKFLFSISSGSCHSPLWLCCPLEAFCNHFTPYHFCEWVYDNVPAFHFILNSLD